MPPTTFVGNSFYVDLSRSVSTKRSHYFVVAFKLLCCCSQTTLKRIFFVTKGHFPGDGVRSDENQKWPLKNGRRKDRFKSEPITFSALLLLHLFFENLFFFWIKKIYWRLYIYDLFKSRNVETLTLDGEGRLTFFRNSSVVLSKFVSKEKLRSFEFMPRWSFLSKFVLSKYFLISKEC